jgi:hypothetical protein
VKRTAVAAGLSASAGLGLILVSTTTAFAHATAYAIAIGNNAPPALDSRLPSLHFADDDAVRYYQFFARFADEAVLLSVLDEQTQKRYPWLLGVAVPPTLAALRSAVRRVAGRVQQDIKRGDQPVVYLTFSGHGGQLPDGAAFLALADGALTRALLQQEILAPLADAFVHVFVDACYAEGVVGPRGLFDEEVNARLTRISDADAARLAEAASMRFPRVGTLAAASAGQQSYEWSQIQSGVFTHELLSGLAGPADVNGDGVVDYAEIQAFLAAANRDLPDPQARPQVVAHAPPINPRQPILSLGAQRDVAFLTGDFSRLGHFHVELDNGERCLDANLSPELHTRIAIPANRQAFVVARDLEALLSAKPGETRNLGSLHFHSRQISPRGSVEASLRDYLFASPFGPTYNRGFQDALGLSPASDLAATTLPGGSPTARRSLAIAAWAASGLSFAAAATTTALALKARSNYQAASLQRDAWEAKDRFSAYRTAAFITAAGGLVGAVAGWLLWPAADGGPVAASLMIGRGAGLALQSGW